MAWHGRGEKSHATLTNFLSYFSILSGYYRFILTTVSVLFALFMWDLYASTQPEYLFPQTAVVFETFVEQWYEFDLATRIFNTLLTIAVGFTFAAVLGIGIGLLMGIDDRAENVLEPYIDALYVSPVSALVPVFILVGGASFSSRVGVVVMFTIFEIIINTHQGVKSMSRETIEVARSFGADTRFVVRNVIIPHDLPYIAAGLRLGIGRAFKGAIFAEILIQFSNLGEVIRRYESSFEIAGVLSIIILVMILAIVTTKLLEIIADRMIVWREEVEL